MVWPGSYLMTSPVMVTIRGLSGLTIVVCFVVTSWATRRVAAAPVANARKKLRHFIGSSFAARIFCRDGGGTALKNDPPHHAGDHAAARDSQVAVFFVFLAAAGYAITVVTLSPPSDLV